MFKLTMPRSEDPRRVQHTADTLDDATAAALILSRESRLTDPSSDLDDFWVDIRDVNSVVIKSVNIWKPNATKPKP